MPLKDDEFNIPPKSFKNCVMTTSPDECVAQLSSVYIELTRQVERTGSESQNCVSLVLFLD